MTGTVRGTVRDPGRPPGAREGPEQHPRPSWQQLVGPQATGPARWVLACAVFGAVMASSLSLYGVLLDFRWFPQAATVTAFTAFAPALIRRFVKYSVLAPIFAFAGWIVSLTLVFFAHTAYLGLIPSPRTVAAARELLQGAGQTILVNTTPVPTDDGITFVICAGLGFAALLIDTLAITIALPAASGIGILLVLLPPALTTDESISTMGFIGAAAGFMLVLGCCRWYAPDGKLRPAANRARSGTFVRAAGLGAVVVLLMTLLPPAIPGFTHGLFPEGTRVGNPGDVSGLDPMISLGNSLRAQSGRVNLTYLTDSDTPLYLRLNTLEDFSGKTWRPSPIPSDLSSDLAAITPDFGPNPVVPTTKTLTAIDSVYLTSHWLPVPYAPTSVESLFGRWTWNPSTLAINGENMTTGGQTYIVHSEAPKLSVDILEAAVGKPRAGLDPIFTRLPDNVPDIIGKTARDVAGGKTTPFDRALALQNYLRSSQFTYSEKTPVQEGYDGAGLNVLAKFLEVKAGYCVHFSAAMAVMARELGIPSRIAVGYAPGQRTAATGRVLGKDLLGFEVVGRDAHAWPELYFEGLGWVPFEPTPSRGAVPPYAQISGVGGQGIGSGDLLNGGVPRATGSAAPSATATAAPPAAVPQTPPQARTSASVVAVLLMLLLFSAPAFTRVLVRRRRLALVRGGGRRERPAPRRGLRTGRATGASGAERAGGTDVPQDGGGGLATLQLVAADPRDAPEILAWRELVDTAVDFGHTPDPSMTPGQQAARIRTMLGGNGHGGSYGGSVDAVRAAFERAVYGPARAGGDGRDDLADAVEDVAAALTARATAGARVRAMAIPASLFKKT
ncbi:transglutaminase TgpA family protein [Specibacter sp. RAF43]|uniref:transglutaminase TgpA family protein n=1 Tax=Specibacter sp. RAF43 TaxID=3233057 RepID=UPI003F95B217